MPLSYVRERTSWLLDPPEMLIHPARLIQAAQISPNDFRQSGMIRFFGVTAIFVAIGATGALADCPPGFESKNGQCEIKRACPIGQTMRDGKCVSASTCPPGQQYMSGLCVTRAPGSTTPNPVFNK